jgi:hypothetical protein
LTRLAYAMTPDDRMISAHTKRQAEMQTCRQFSASPGRIANSFILPSTYLGPCGLGH